MKRIIITKNSVVKTQNLVVNHKSRPVKLNSDIYESDQGGWNSSSSSELTTEKAFFLIITLINQEVWRLTKSRPPFFKVGEVSYDYLPRRWEGDLENFKKGWKYGARAGLLKTGGGGVTPFLYNFFKVYHFYIFKHFETFLHFYFTLCKIVVCKKNYFFLSP